MLCNVLYLATTVTDLYTYGLHSALLKQIKECATEQKIRQRLQKVLSFNLYLHVCSIHVFS